MKFNDLFPGFKMVSSFLHPEKGYEKAQEQYQKSYDEAQSYMQPYNTNGQNIYPSYSNAINKMLNPADLEAEWMQGYEQSPSAKYAIEDAMYHGKNALSSMGLGGSSPAIRAMQEGSHRIAENDKLGYLSRLWNMYSQGAGLAGNVYGQGQNAAGAMGQNAMNFGNNMGEAAYGAQNAPGNQFGSMLGAILGVIGGKNNLGQDNFKGGGGNMYDINGGNWKSNQPANFFGYSNPGMNPWMGG